MEQQPRRPRPDTRQPESRLPESRLIAAMTGSDSPGLIHRCLTAAITCGCTVKDTRVAVLEGIMTLTVLLSGHWSAIAKVEQALPRLAERLDLSLTLKRAPIKAPYGPSDTQGTTEPGISASCIPPPCIPYAVEVTALESSSVVRDITGFFAEHQINIEEMYSNTYTSAYTQAAMLSVHMTISIPSTLNIATLRGEFMDFCDDRNLDAVLAPAK